MAGESAKRRKRKPKVKRDNPAQSKKFIESAKALGVDETGREFDRLLDKVVRRKR